MNFDEYLLKGMKDFLKSLALKQCKCLTNKHSFEIYSFEKCRSEQFLSSLYEQYEVLRIGDNKSAQDFKEVILERVNYGVKKLNNSPYRPYVAAYTEMVLNRSCGKYFPLAHEPLFNIFYYTNQQFRQQYFGDLLSYYYTILKEELPFDIISSLGKVWENLLKATIPLAKLDILFMVYETSGFGDISTFARPLMVELNEIAMYPDILREDCYKIVENKVNSRNFKLTNFKLVPFNGQPGYLGEYFQLHSTVEIGRRTEIFQMFVKFLASKNQTLKDISALAFKKEAFIYRDFVPKLKDFGLQEIADFAPECYFIRNDDVMIFEDLSIANFTSSDLSLSQGYDWLTLALKKLAQFHACSLLLENKIGKEIGEEYKEYLGEVMWSKEKMSGEIMSCSVRTTIEYYLKKFPDILKNITLDQFKQQVEAAFDLMYDHIAMSTCYKNVICHGDTWGTNILTRKEGDTPKQCYLIDFQLIRYCPPMVDILFFIYMSTTKAMRTAFKSKLLDVYYESLSIIFDRFDVDINNIYSKETFLKGCEEFESSSICQAVCYQQILHLPKQTLEKINNDEQISHQFFNVDRCDIFDEILDKDERYRSIMREILEDLYNVLNV